MKKRFIAYGSFAGAAGCLMLLLMFAQLAQAADLGATLSDRIDCGALCDEAFAVFVGGDLILAPGGQIEGRTAVSGSLQLAGAGTYTFVLGSDSPSGSGYSAPNLMANLIVAGDIDIGGANTLRVDGLEIISGDVTVGGVVTGTIVAHNGPVPFSQPIPVDFAGAFAELRGASQCWKEISTTGDLVASGSDWLLQGDGSSYLQVFDITSFPSSGVIGFAAIPVTATVLVNVTGTVVYSGPGMTDITYRENTLFNFYGADSVAFSATSGVWRGSILAPGAQSILTTGIDVQGRVVVGGDLIQTTAGTEMHLFPFKGDLPPCDWGDLPDNHSGVGPGNYVTLVRGETDPNLIGPDHILTDGVYLGACVDAEPKGQPNTAANKDDEKPPHGVGPHYPDVIGVCGASGGFEENDEDGVHVGPGSGIGGTWQAGGGGGGIIVTGTLGDCFNGWIDFNNNGSFADTNEQVAANVSLSSAPQTIVFTVPNGVLGSNVTFYSRYRLTNSCTDYVFGSPAPTGPATTGEVEDYMWTFFPTATALADFRARVDDDHVLLQWETANEVDTIGFNLYRTGPSGEPAVRINPALILALVAGNPVGAAYQWVDASGLEPGQTYAYVLEAVALDGSSVHHAPVSVTFGVATHRLFLPMTGR